MIITGAGNDILDGGAGADQLEGGSGNDTYFVEDLGDVVVEGAGEGRDTLYVTVDNFVLEAGQHVEQLKVASSITPGLTLTGNELANTVVGRTGNDTLNGGGGNDLLNGLAGTDTVSGGAGNDIIFVANAGDVVIETAGEGRDAVYATTSYTLAAGQEIETLLSWFAEGITLIGNKFNNTINGHTGAETLNGGFGNDALTGRAGADVFQFDDAWGADSIRDFEDDVDTIDFSLVDGLEPAGLGYAQAGLNVVISFGGNQVTVLNTTIAALQDDVVA